MQQNNTLNKGDGDDKSNFAEEEDDDEDEDEDEDDGIVFDIFTTFISFMVFTEL